MYDGTMKRRNEELNNQYDYPGVRKKRRKQRTWIAITKYIMYILYPVSRSTVMNYIKDMKVVTL